MKIKLPLLTGVAAACLLTCQAQADESTNNMSQNMNRSDRLNGVVKASDFIGLEVQNYQNEKLGKVDDLSLDVASGRVVSVIISGSGLTDQGSKLVAVPASALHHDAANQVLHLDASQEKFAASPRLSYANWDESTQPNRIGDTYAYYGTQPYFSTEGGNNGNSYSESNMNGTVAGTLPRNMDGRVNTNAGRATDTAHNIKIAGNGRDTNALGQNANSAWNQQHYGDNNAGNSGSSQLGQIQRASKLMGTTVKNMQDEKLGTVKNLAIDVAAGRIVAVIISSGGFAGIGTKLNAVPPTALRSDIAHDALLLDVSKETLASSPRFNDSQWNELGQPAYVGGIYRNYNKEPYFGQSGTWDRTDAMETNGVTAMTETNGVGAADNTRRNVRDRNQRTLTPLNQGNSKEDINTTAQIRKGIIATENMSTNAKNVKIITLDGHVTLRGAVNSEQEKKLIEEIAERNPHVGPVDNQLEVTTSTPTDLN